MQGSSEASRRGITTTLGRSLRRHGEISQGDRQPSQPVNKLAASVAYIQKHMPTPGGDGKKKEGDMKDGDTHRASWKHR